MALRTYIATPPATGGSGGIGNVVGPASATDGHLAVFDGTTGKLIKDGGAVPAGTVTNVSSANGAITVATGTTTPVLTAVYAPALKSATTTVDVSAATAPSVGQVLTAVDSTHATWQPGGISGLTPNTLPKALTASTIGDSRITDDGTTISLNGLVNVANNAIGIDSQSGTTTIGDVGDVGNGTTLTVDDGGNLIDASGGGGILKTNTLMPAVANGGNVGGVTLPYSSLIIGNAANNSAQLTGTFTGNRVATFPDASGTVQLVGAANTGCVLTCLSNNTVLSTATGQVFTSPGNDGTPLTVTSEGAVGWVVTRAGTIRNLYIRSGTTAKVNTPATAVVVRKNGADTALTVAAITQTTTTTSSDVAHSFAVVAGDVITVSLTTTGVAGVSVSIASLTFELD